MANSKAKQRVVLDEKAQMRWNAKVKKTDDCWFWTGGLTSRGYANFRVGANYVERAHVLAYLMTKGDIVAGLQVRHVCPGDQHHKHCVNPAHLALGTAKQNGEDKARLGSFKGVMIGEKNPRAKLSDDRVVEIHGRVHAGESPSDLGLEFGVTPRQVRMIRDGHTRKHLGLPVKPITPRGPNEKRRETRRGLHEAPDLDEISRFNEKFTKGPDCWIWGAATDKANDGDQLNYGQFSFRGRNVGAHIFAFMLAYGSAPPNHDIAHKCANTLCVNPEHLWARSRKQNMANKLTRERLSESKKSNRNRAVLTDEQIREVKEIYRDEPELADQEIVERLQLLVGAPALARIRKGQTGGHVIVEGFESQTRLGKAAHGQRNRRSKLKPEQIYEIRRLGDGGEHALALSKEFDVSRRTIDDIVARRTWKHLPDEVGTLISPIS